MDRQQNNTNPIQQPAAPQNEAHYQPIAVPTKREKGPGTTEGVFGIISGVASLLFIPILFGIIGIFLGVRSLNKGSKGLGLTAIILSSVFMVIGIILGAVYTHLKATGRLGGIMFGI